MDMLCVTSLGLGREHILYFLRIDYASVGECEFPVLECATVARSYKVSDTLTVFVTGNQEYIKIGNEATSKIATIVHQKR